MPVEVEVADTELLLVAMVEQVVEVAELPPPVLLVQAEVMAVATEQQEAMLDLAELIVVVEVEVVDMAVPIHLVVPEVPVS